MRAALRQLWGRLPALVRGPVLAFLILAIGQLPPGVFLVVGLQFTPRVPWWPVPTIARRFSRLVCGANLDLVPRCRRLRHGRRVERGAVDRPGRRSSA